MRVKIPIEIVVGVLGGVSCLVAWPGLGIPVWALFIGWAWYFALGATPKVMKNIYPSMIPGAVLAAICIALINVLSPYMHPMLAMILPVTLTVFLLMMALKIPLTNCSLPAFNAYSTTFAVFYGGFYPANENVWIAIVVAMVWALIGNAMGPLFGWLSIFFSTKKEKA